MAKRLLLAALLLGALLTSAVAAAASTQVLRARLVPVAPVRSGGGTLAASGRATKGSVALTWTLAVSNLTGSPTRVLLKLTGSGITLSLCKPCSASAHGKLVLVPSLWRQLSAGHGVVVVATRAHPGGEVRGTLRGS
jgi:hypothetical protein